MCNMIEIKTNEMFQSFLVERNLNQWFLGKKSFGNDAFGDFTTNSLGKKKYEKVKTCEGYTVIEKFDEVCS